MARFWLKKVLRLCNLCDGSMKERTQQGFTLLEIAILLVIVGLILAGVIKGQEMITSAKVKRVAGQIDEIRAAYFGFQDRYKALPGDYSDADTNMDCGSSACLKGDGDGRIRANDIPIAGSQAHEDILVWTHLSGSGLLKGDYKMADGESLANDTDTPRNPYSAYLQIVFDGDYGLGGVGVVVIGDLAEIGHGVEVRFGGVVGFGPVCADFAGDVVEWAVWHGDVLSWNAIVRWAG